MRQTTPTSTLLLAGDYVLGFLWRAYVVDARLERDTREEHAHRHPKPPTHLPSQDAM